MADSVPDRWSRVFNRSWYLVDEVEFITMVQANGQWTTDTIVDVEVAFDPNGWLFWRETDQSAGGAFAPDKVVHVEWATP